ncbi:MAG: recombinase family protein [Gaiellaceae bacterium]
MSKGNGRPLRFAPLVRVSTEKQEQQGESLRTQRKYNERDVKRLGGSVVGWYGGQEHGTPGWEKAEVDRLIDDAGKGIYDAVIVAYADRWSRDNAKSKEGLEVFRKHGIRFFVGSAEQDLFDPQVRLTLGMFAEIGEFIALQQAKKSVESRIERAMRGIPVAGRMPFGRTFDKETGKWAVDSEKKARIGEIARRYLAGESLPGLADEYGWHRGNLRETLRDRCGDQWVQEFRVPNLNIDEVITTRVPRLLEEETIKKIRERLVANRTYLHKPPRPVHEYLLAGYLRCSGCGYCMFGQTHVENGHSYRYYRHAHKDRARECPVRPRPWVRADAVEPAVVRDLFAMFGNPAAIERAVKAAVPDCEKEMKRRAQLEGEVAKVEKSRGRILDLVTKDVITADQAEKQLRDLKDREAALRDHLDKIASTLANVPTEDAIRCYVERVKDAAGDIIFVYDDAGNPHPGGNDLGTWLTMTPGDRRKMVEAVFSSPLPDGTPAGVYVEQDGEAGAYRPKGWKFTIRGRLQFELVMRGAGRSPNGRHYEPTFTLTGRV